MRQAKRSSFMEKECRRVRKRASLVMMLARAACIAALSTPGMVLTPAVKEKQRELRRQAQDVFFGDGKLAQEE